MAPILAAFYRTGTRFPLPEAVILVGALGAASLVPAVERGSWLALTLQVPVGIGAALAAIAVKRSGPAENAMVAGNPGSSERFGPVDPPESQGRKLDAVLGGGMGLIVLVWVCSLVAYLVDGAFAWLALGAAVAGLLFLAMLWAASRVLEVPFSATLRIKSLVEHQRRGRR